MSEARPATTAFDADALDRTERRFWRDAWSAVPEEEAERRGALLGVFGPVQATILTALPGARMVNLVLGAAERGAISAGHLSRALEWARGNGVDLYVPVSPHGPEADTAESWLDANGFERGYSWMKFVRDASPPDLPEPDGVEVREVAAAEGEAFAAIVAAGFGMPAWASILFSELPGSPGWRCYLAQVDGTPSASAAMLVDGTIAEFGMAATLESARGRGCQTALLRRRIIDAARDGCETLFVETGERVADRPSGSYRNILRAGFEEAYLRPNWQPRSG
jgi:GNAT superfamily N-acetyltransferase